MAKIQKRHIDQINRVWGDLMQEAYDALSYVDCDNDCDGKYNKTLERLDDRFERALENIINDANK